MAQSRPRGASSWRGLMTFSSDVLTVTSPRSPRSMRRRPRGPTDSHYECLRDRDLAEDAVQEAYLTIWRQAARFDRRKGSSLGWIFMVVHRVAIDHVRGAIPRAVRDDRYAREETVRVIPVDQTHDLVQASLEARTVRAALADLSALQRQVIQLAYFDGYTYSEVADLLGIPLGTAKTRIRDGLLRLGGPRQSGPSKRLQGPRAGYPVCCELSEVVARARGLWSPGLDDARPPAVTSPSMPPCRRGPRRPAPRSPASRCWRPARRDPS